MRKGAKKPWVLRGRKERARVRRNKLRVMTPEQLEAERTRLALTPPPRKECPVCLFTLMDERQEEFGHHERCEPRMEAILRKVHEEKKLAEEFHVPGEIAQRRERLVKLKEEALAAGAAAIKSQRAYWKATGELRHLCMSLRVCFGCMALPAGPSNMCLACEAVYREQWKYSRS